MTCVATLSLAIFALCESIFTITYIIHSSSWNLIPEIFVMRDRHVNQFEKLGATALDFMLCSFRDIMISDISFL